MQGLSSGPYAAASPLPAKPKSGFGPTWRRQATGWGQSAWPISRAGAASFEIPFNRQQLADYLSADRSALSAELSRMRGEGLIEFEKNSFRLL